MKFLIFLVFFLSLSSISALNETNVTYADNTGEIWQISNETEEPEPEPICEEQLQLLLDEYNNLSKDYHEGASCGTVVYLLKDNNKICGENLAKCREKVGKYRFGFWFFGILLIIVALIIFFYNLSSRNKLLQEDKNGARETGKTDRKGNT